MNFIKQDLVPGLYLVATPIGTARDITLRALDILASADILVAEDTRSLRRLFQIHGLTIGDRPLIAYHDHSAAKARNRLIGMLSDGKSMAYASEAGTPLVADPGYQLVNDALAAGINVTSAPGPSAAIAALSIAGLPTDRFFFAGFAPTGKSARRKWLSEIGSVAATLVVYESPKRVLAMLKEMLDLWGPDRQVAVCRELTKRFENITRGSLQDLCDDDALTLKGEFVLLIDRDRQSPDEADVADQTREALKSMSVKDAATFVSENSGVSRRDVYQLALRLDKES